VVLVMGGGRGGFRFGDARKGAENRKGKRICWFTDYERAGSHSQLCEFRFDAPNEFRLSREDIYLSSLPHQISKLPYSTTTTTTLINIQLNLK
jgi:hypothetical protein